MPDKAKKKEYIQDGETWVIILRLLAKVLKLIGNSIHCLCRQRFEWAFGKLVQDFNTLILGFCRIVVSGVLVFGLWYLVFVIWFAFVMIGGEIYLQMSGWVASLGRN